MASTSPAASPAATASISDHASTADASLRRSFGPRIRKLHARIGKAHHQAEGMDFSRALLAGEATPGQLVALLTALVPAYGLLEQQAPKLAHNLGAPPIPWADLARSTALRHDLALVADLPTPPPSAAAQAWLAHLEQLAEQAPHRFLAHAYVRYGGDLSGGQQLAAQANAILARQGLSPLSFWAFGRPVAELKGALHDGFEQLQLTEREEEDLLEEAEAAFLLTQRLLAELAPLA
jgi:heme oxygenase